MFTESLQQPCSRTTAPSSLVKARATKGRKETVRDDGMFIISSMVMGSWVYTYVKVHKSTFLEPCSSLQVNYTSTRCSHLC